MKVYISKINQIKYKYLLEWIFEGVGYADRFETLKDLNEYIANWDAEIIFAGKETA